MIYKFSQFRTERKTNLLERVLCVTNVAILHTCVMDLVNAIVIYLSISFVYRFAA